MILGITGGSGSGKTTLLHLLETAGVSVLDCDAIYHRLVREDASLLRAIDARFPGTVSAGQLDRKKLGNIVFACEDELVALNAITHDAVRAEICRLLTQTPSASAAIDAIGLFEAQLDRLCTVTVAVTAPKAARVERLMKREGISGAYAEKRIAAQHEDDWFRTKCDYLLENDTTIEAFEAKCLAFLHDVGIIREEFHSQIKEETNNDCG